MRKLTLPLLALVIAVTSCSKDDDECGDCAPIINLPETYNFENVSFSGQTTRLNMLSEIVTYIKTGNTGASIDKQQLQNMFANNSYTWQNTDLNGSSKQLANKVSTDAQANFVAWFDMIDAASKSTQNGSNGTAGLVTNGTKTYLFDENGIEPAQLIEKGAMGAVFYYQATSVYFGDGKMNVDNTSVEPGVGTEMQHHWDEAFGYFGVPLDFASDGFTYTSGESYDRFWAKYCNGRNELTGSNKDLMTAFIKGREAIGRNDLTTRDQAISEARAAWELVSAATAIHYLNEAKANISDDALRNHQLSEAYAFIWSLKFNPDKKMSDTEIDNDIINTYFGNFYNISIQDINTVRDMLSSRYDLDAVKESL